jgi:hypothetical protein
MLGQVDVGQLDGLRRLGSFPDLLSELPDDSLWRFHSAEAKIRVAQIDVVYLNGIDQICGSFPEEPPLFTFDL